MAFSLLTAAAMPSFAGSDYAVVQGNAIVSMSDGASHKLVRSFTLPSNVSLSTATVRSAILEMETRNVDFTTNEVYVNPPTTVCTSDGAEDANQPASIGYIDPHPTVRTEYFSDSISFASSKLKVGTNTIMVCIRSSAGLGGASGVNLDNINLRNIVVDYQVN